MDILRTLREQRCAIPRRTLFSTLNDKEPLTIITSSVTFIVKKKKYHSCTFQRRYTLVKPVIFGVGDIVEVQASFMAVPLKQGKFKTTMVLRGITLIDGTFTQVQKRILSDKRTYQTNSLLAIKNSSSDYYQTERNSSNHTKAKSWLPGRRIIRDQSQNESHGSRYTTFTTAKGKP